MATTVADTALRFLDDKTLIEKAVAGHNACFDVLMDRYLYMVRNRVHTMISDQAEAEDVLQEVQLNIWTHLSSFRRDSSFRTWITRIATNGALQSYRRARTRRKCDAMDFDRLAAPTDSPEQLYARQEMAGALREAIRGLPAKFRQIVVLRELRELSIKETAHELNANLPLVKTRLFRARLMLSKALGQKRKRPVTGCHARMAA